MPLLSCGAACRSLLLLFMTAIVIVSPRLLRAEGQTLQNRPEAVIESKCGTALLRRDAAMTSSTRPAIAEQDPIEVPRYTPWDVVHYLRLVPGALSTLTGRLNGAPYPQGNHAYFWGPFPPLLGSEVFIRMGASDEEGRMTFRELADLFVRAAVPHALMEWVRTGDEDDKRWADLYMVLGRGLEGMQREPVPFDHSPVEDRVDGLVRPFAGSLEEEDLRLLRKTFTLRLERVETREGMPVRLYPFSRDPAERSPRKIVLDPRLRFGKPTLAEHGVPTDSLFERYLAGDSIRELAEDYGLPTAEVEEAIRYESLPLIPLSSFYDE